MNVYSIHTQKIIFLHGKRYTLWYDQNGKLNLTKENAMSNTETSTEDQAPARVDKQVLSGIMRFFEYDHLPEQLQKVSAPICDMAVKLNEELTEGEEKSAGLRKLLEAKDCFVRASFDK